jgi:hypothetical protein
VASEDEGETDGLNLTGRDQYELRWAVPAMLAAATSVNTQKRPYVNT